MSDNSQSEKPLALVVEDDPGQAAIFERALQMANFEVQVISDGQLALTTLAETFPALVVLDIHLPYVSGGDILRQIRADERLKKTRVMLATANPLAAESLRQDSDLVLIKPISFNQLRDLASRLYPS